MLSSVIFSDVSLFSYQSFSSSLMDLRSRTDRDFSGTLNFSPRFETYLCKVMFFFIFKHRCFVFPSIFGVIKIVVRLTLSSFPILVLFCQNYQERLEEKLYRSNFQNSGSRISFQGKVMWTLSLLGKHCHSGSWHISYLI